MARQDMPLSEHLLQVRFGHRAQVVRVSRHEASELEIFFPSRQRVPLGRQVRVAVSFDDAPDQFELAGRVTFVRAGTSSGAEPGIGVAFEGEGRKEAAVLLAFCAGVAGMDEKGPAKRVRLRARCRVVVGNDRYEGEVVDLSVTGVFVNAPKVPRLRVGSKIGLQFKEGLLRWGPILDLRVMWHGEKRGVNGFGGRFLADPATVALEIRQHLDLGPKK
jgi:hypothetical protein